MPLATRWATTVLLLGVGAFQVALAAGAPWGRLAWGGAHDGTLPDRLRAGSGAAALAALAVLAWSPGPSGRRRAVRVAAVLMVGGALNLASPSLPEKLVWAPVAAALAVLLWRRAGRRDAD